MNAGRNGFRARLYEAPRMTGERACHHFWLSFRGDAKHRARNLFFQKFRRFDGVFGAPLRNLRSHSSRMPGGKRGIQIAPMRVLFLDQANFPSAAPFLQFFLAHDRRLDVIMNFEPD